MSTHSNSEATFKCASWTPQGRPPENTEIKEYRQLIREAIFSIYRDKKERLAAKGMPAQPVSLLEIYLKIRARIVELKNTGDWPYKPHNKRYVDRRVNEVSTAKYYDDGIPKVVSVKAGLYWPNPALFEKKPMEAQA